MTTTSKKNSERPSALGALGAFAVLAVSCVLALDYVLERGTVLAKAEGITSRLWDLAVLGLFLVSSTSLGAGLLDRIRFVDRSPVQRLWMSWALGFCGLYIAAVGLAAAQFVRPWVLFLVVLAPLVIFFRSLSRLAKRLHRASRDLRRPNIVGVTAGALGLLYAVFALSPPCFIDPLTYHLVIPQETLDAGGVPRTEDNFFNVFPPAMSMLYMYLMALGSHFLPKLLHACFLGFTLIAGFDSFSRLFGRRVAGWGTLLFLAEWSVQHAVLRANVDFHFAFYGLGALLLLLEAGKVAAPQAKLNRSALMLSGVLLGTAISSKLHSINCLIGCSALFAYYGAQKKLRLSDVALFFVAAGAVYLPTFIRNLIYAQDPLLLAAMGPLGFGEDSSWVARFSAMANWKGLSMVKVTPLSLVLTPFWAYRDGAFPTTNFDAFILPFYLVSIPVGLLFLRKDKLLRPVYVYLGGFYLAWLLTAALTRYAFPILPVLSVVTARVFLLLSQAAGSKAERAFVPAFRWLIVVISLSSGVNAAIQNRGFLAFNLPAFFELIDRKEFVSKLRPRVVDTMKIEQIIYEREFELPERPAPEDSKVFMVFASESYDLRHRYSNDAFMVNALLLRDAQRKGTAPLTWLRDQGFRWVLYDPSRIPWLENRRKKNPHLNPYPEALTRFRGIVSYFESEIRPQLRPLGKEGRFELLEIPEPGASNAPGPPAAETP